MGKKSGMGKGKKGGGGKGRSISNVKKTNIKRNKLAKSGKMKPMGSKPKFVEGGHLQARAEERKARKRETASMSALDAEQIQSEKKQKEELKKQQEEEALEEMVDMMDPEDVAFLRAQSAKARSSGKKGRNKRSRSDGEDSDEESDEDDNLELNALEKRAKTAATQQQNGEVDEEDRKDLLPVRTKQGWVQRSTIMPASEPEEDEVNGEGEVDGAKDEDSGDDSGSEDEDDGQEEIRGKEFSVIELVAKRREYLAEKKTEVGSMASNFLEVPHERVNVLEKLVKMVPSSAGSNKDNKGILTTAKHTVSKLTILTVCEILKDVLPNYKIQEAGSKEDKDEGPKLKKETLKLQKYEQAVLTATKKFLVKLEKIVSTTSDQATVHVKETALSSMCELLVAHPQFNYAQNIVAFVTPQLCSGIPQLRAIVLKNLQALLKSDKRGEITHAVVKRINHFLKTKKRDRIKPEMLEALLALKLHALNEAQAEAHRKEEEAKEAKKKKAKGFEPQMSKKDRKRAKARKKLDKELLEAKGEESKQIRLSFAADSTNLLFAIYFRILKTMTSPDGEADKFTGKHFRLILRPLFSGLARFGHLMSIEYFQDLLRCVALLLSSEYENRLGKVEVLLCIQTVFAILSGQGDQLTIDPVTFYKRIASIALDLSQADEQEEDSSQVTAHSVMYEVLKSAFIVRRKKVSKNQLVDIWKRVCLSALHSSAEGAAHLIRFLRESAVTNSSLWSGQMRPDEDSELAGVASGGNTTLAAAGRNLSALGNLACGDAKNEPEVGILNGQILNGNSLAWDVALLTRHPDSKVVEAAYELLHAGSATAVQKRPAGNRLSEVTDVNIGDIGFPILEDEENLDRGKYSILREDLPKYHKPSSKKRRKNK